MLTYEVIPDWTIRSYRNLFLPASDIFEHIR